MLSSKPKNDLVKIIHVERVRALVTEYVKVEVAILENEYKYFEMNVLKDI